MGKYIASVSFGKDSLAMLLYILENKLPLDEVVFYDTGMEFQAIYWELIDALGKVENETQRDAYAMQIFGKSAQELNPLIKAGSDEMANLAAEAREAGLVLSEETVGDLGAFDDTMQKTKAQIEGIGRQIAVNFLPAVQSVGTGIQGVLSDIGGALSDGFQAEDVQAIGESISAKLVEGLGAISTYLPSFMGTISTMLSQVVDMIVTLLPTLLPSLMQAALSLFQNILGALTKNSKAIVNVIMELLKMIITFITANLPSFIDAGLKIIVALIEGIAAALPDIIQAIVDMIPQLIQAIVDNLPLIIDAGVTLILSLVQGLINAIPQLLAALPTIISALLNGILAAIPQIINAGIQLLTSLVAALPTIIQTIVAVLPQIISGIINALLANLPLIIQAGIDLLVALVQALPTIIVTIVQAIPQIIGGIIDALIGNIDKIILAGVQLFVALIENTPKIIVEIVKAIPQIIGGIVNAIIGFVPKLAECGLNLIKGLWNGISDAGAWLWDKISGFFGGITDKIKDFFGIHSPSTMFRDMIGKNLVRGIAVGVDVETPNLQDDLQENLGSVTAGLEGTLEAENAKLKVSGGGFGSINLAGTLIALWKKEHKREKAVENGVQCLLRAEIIRQYEKWIDRRYCPLYAKEALRREYAAYHALHGNDVATGLYNEVMALPTEEPKSVNMPKGTL